MTGKGGAAAPDARNGATKPGQKKGAPKKGDQQKGAPKKGPEGAEDLRVRAGEDPWTTEEIQEVIAELEADRQRLQDEVDAAEADLAQLMRESGEGSGDDQADAGAATWEREHELSLANNAKELLEQIERAQERIREGTYGLCESCGEPVGKMRLQAFPRATLCLSCKQKQERR